MTENQINSDELGICMWVLNKHTGGAYKVIGYEVENRVYVLGKHRGEESRWADYLFEQCFYYPVHPFEVC